MADREPQTLPELQATHKPAPRSRLHSAPPPGEADEHSAVRNYVRDLILGFNDGLVSVFAAVAGVAAASESATIVVLAGLAFAVAGALSMGLGEYLSTKSQSEYYAAEGAREREHIRKHAKLERQEVLDMLRAKHYPPDLVERIADHVVSDEDRFVEFMMREEFGVGQESERSPFVAMGLIMLAFVVGTVLPLAPFVLGVGGVRGLAIAATLSLGGLFVAGAVKGVTSGLRWWRSGLEMLALGAIAAVITYGVGYAVRIWFGIGVAG